MSKKFMSQDLVSCMKHGVNLFKNNLFLQSKFFQMEIYYLEFRGVLVYVIWVALYELGPSRTILETSCLNEFDSVSII